MTFDECVNRFREIAADRTFSDIADSYIQVNIIGRESGKFYLHFRDGIMHIVTGEYRERNTLWIVNLGILSKIMDGILDPIYAYTTGKFNMMGDISLGRKILVDISKVSR